MIETVDIQKQDIAEDTSYYNFCLQEMKIFLEENKIALSSYLERCEVNGFIPDYMGCSAVNDIRKQLDSITTRFEKIIDQPLPLNMRAYTQRVNNLNSLYRMAVQLRVPASRILSWCSTSYDQSLETAFFQIPKLDDHDAEFKYDRSCSLRSIRLENHFLDMIGFDQNSVSVLTTSSGMAAYSLIEKYLIRDILEQNDIIYSPRYDYGELQNIKFCGKLFSIVQHENDNHDEIINYILNCCPKVVFLSSIYNIPGTPVLDILFILEKIYNSEYQKDIHIIIDDSLVTGAINPFIFQTDFINIYYFSSAIKYLQAGMDSGFAGILAVNKSKFDCFRKLRGMTGLGLYDNSAWLYPLQTFEIYQARMRRLTRNALLVAEKLQENEEFYKHWDVQYPLLQNHPDYHSAKKLPFIGSLVTLVPRSAPLFANFENVQPLFKLIDRILRSAHEEGISIIRSESFGFSDVRINAYGWYNRKPPYIRLSCGDRCYEEIHHIVTKLSEIILQESLKIYDLDLNCSHNISK